MQALPKLSVYYNTKCPVCDFGITHQKRKLINAVRENRIEFRDINLEPNALRKHGSDIEFVRKRLHALDADGQLYIGVEAGAEIWRRTEGQQGLAAFFRLPVISFLARIAYNGFAELLYLWNRVLRHW